MKKHLQKVFNELRTRKDVVALGLSRRELKGVAAKIADKLSLNDDATDDEVNDAIDDAIDAVVPFLQVSQTVADRRLQSYKDSLKSDDGDDKKDDDEPDDKKPPKKDEGQGKDKDKGDDGNAALLKALKEIRETLQTQQNELQSIKNCNVVSGRRDALQKVLAGTGKYGERVMKSFSRMTFKDDDDFSDYLDDVKDGIEAENQERAERGLEKLGTLPPTTQKKKSNAAEEVMSDDEIKALAGV